MESLPELLQRYGADPSRDYRCQGTLNLYDSPQLTALATQAAAGRQLRILPPSFCPSDLRLETPTIPVCLCEDDYPGWIAADDWSLLHPADHAYEALTWTAAAIGDRIPEIIAYMETAMAHPNHYLWGGTVGPNYDCSGLMQAAFASVGIWLPRDAYQQEAFTQSVALDQLQRGDLIFFGPVERANHVALFLGDGRYIHSSGTAIGRNGIGCDRLEPGEDAVGRAYRELVHGAGRVVASYQPQGVPIKAIDAAPVTPMV